MEYYQRQKYCSLSYTLGLPNLENVKRYDKKAFYEVHR